MPQREKKRNSLKGRREQRVKEKLRKIWRNEKANRRKI